MSNGGGSDPLAKAGKDAAGNNDVFGGHVYRIFRAYEIVIIVQGKVTRTDLISQVVKLLRVFMAICRMG